MHISSYNFLVSPQKDATYKAVELAQTLGLQISMDVGVEPALRVKHEIINLLPKLSLIVLSVSEAQELIGARSIYKILNSLLDSGVKVVGLKLGEDGCILSDRDGIYKVPGFRVETVDTTGAGDAFCAGLIYGAMNGLSIAASGLLANALGALATTVWGGGPVLPGRLDLVDFIGGQANYLVDSGFSQDLDEIMHLLSVMDA